VTYFGVFNLGTSHLGAKIGQNKTMTNISRFTVIMNLHVCPLSNGQFCIMNVEILLKDSSNYQVLNLSDNGKQLAKNSIDKNMCENKLYHSILKFNAKNSDLFSIFIPPLIRISQNRILPFLLRYICVNNLISMCELFINKIFQNRPCVCIYMYNGNWQSFTWERSKTKRYRLGNINIKIY
jgi:hypothetical protein